MEMEVRPPRRGHYSAGPGVSELEGEARGSQISQEEVLVA